METTQPRCCSRKRTNAIVVMILAFYPLMGMGIDLISPALPGIARALVTPEAFSKNLIASYLLGYALGNFIFGFLSDAWGRRKILLIGLLLFVLASLSPPLFPHSFILLLCRVLQGLGLGAFGVTARAIFSDILPPERLMQNATLIATMWGLGPIIGPVIGGYLEVYFSWKACFYFYGVLGLLPLVSFYFLLPETHHNRHAFHFRQFAGECKSVLQHRIFIGLTLLMGLTYSLLISFNTLGPFLIQNSLGFSAIFFGHVALSMGVAFLMGTMLCRRLVKTYRPEALFHTSLLLAIVLASLTLIVAYFQGHNISLIISISLCMFLIGGIAFPAGMGKALALFRHISGTATAILNAGTLLITSLVSTLASFLSLQSLVPLAWIYLSLAASSFAIYWCLIRKPLEAKKNS